MSPRLGIFVFAVVLAAAGAWIALRPARGPVPAARLEGRVLYRGISVDGAAIDLVDLGPCDRNPEGLLCPLRARLFEPDVVVATATTGGYGRFELAAPERGRFAVRVRVEGHRTTWSRAIHLEPGRPLPHVGIKLSESVPIEGVVVDESGAPLAGAIVVLAGSGDLVDDGEFKGERLVTGADGRWNSRADPRWTSFAFRCEGFADRLLTFPEVEDSPFRILLLRPARLEGRVLDDATGAGVEGARVAATLPWNPWGLVQAEARSDAGGRFSLEGVLSGRPFELVASRAGYTLVALPPDPDNFRIGLDTTVSQMVDPIPAGGTASCELWMRAGGPVRGRIVDADSGSGIGGADVVLVQPFVERYQRVKSDAGGSFAFPCAATGPAAVFAWREGWFLHEHDADVTPDCCGMNLERWMKIRRGATVDSKIVRLERGVPLSGRVVDASGEPVAGARLRWGNHWAGPFETTQEQALVGIDVSTTFSDAQGRFRFDAVPRHAKFTLRATHIDLPESIEVEVEVKGEAVGPFELRPR